MSRAMSFSSGIMRAVGGMAGAPRATNNNGTIAKNFVMPESLQHSPECKRYQNDTADNKSATADGRQFATRKPATHSRMQQISKRH